MNHRLQSGSGAIRNDSCVYFSVTFKQSEERIGKETNIQTLRKISNRNFFKRLL